MLFLKAITKDGSLEYFNVNQILNIKPYGENLKYLKILMGAGLYWYIEKDSLEIVNLENIIEKE